MENFTLDIQKEAEGYTGSGTVLPPADYVATLLTANQVDSRGGKMTVFDWDINGTVIKDRFCLFHPNEVPRNIARQTLAKICDIMGKTGQFQLKDMPSLFGLQVGIKLAKGEFKGKDGNMIPKNDIKKYMTVAEVQTATQPAQTTMATTGDSAW